MRVEFQGLAGMIRPSPRGNPGEKYMNQAKRIRNLLALVGLLCAGPLLAKPTGDQVNEAICDGDLNAVQRYVAQGWGINDPLDAEGENTALTLASYCYGGQPEIAAWLLQRGADVNKHARDHYSNLMWALRSVDAEGDAMHKVAWDMIRKGANVDYHDSTHGRTALMLASSNGDLKIVQELIRRGADRNRKTKSDWCVSGNYDLQCTAMDYARLDGNVEIALFLEGKNPATYKQSLHYAARQGDLARVQALIQSGADVNAAEDMSQLTPLHYAVRGNHLAVVKALLAAGAKPSPQDYVGITPLRDAIVKYRKEMAMALINAGATGSSEQLQGCGGGLTEFGWALSYGLFDVAKLLIEKNAVDLQGGWGVFREIDGANEETVRIAEMVLIRGAKPPEDYISLLEKWHTEYNYEYAPQIIALVKKHEQKPVIPIPSILIPDNPDFDPSAPPEPRALESLKIRTRSLKPDPELQEKIERSKQFYDKKERLSPDLHTTR
ncbi:MAG: hypothetical protein CMN76_02340 [Spirochaetaceae bacterium]|nr:hypothetical protein [Spirochaetaceae bacterium]